MQVARKTGTPDQVRNIAEYRFSVRSASPSPDAKMQAFREGRMPRARISIDPTESIDADDRDGALAEHVAHAVADVAAGAGIRVHDIECHAGNGTPRAFTVYVHGNAPASRFALLERVARRRLAVNGTAGLDLRIVGR